MNSNYDYLFKIILVGDAGVGKSSLVLRLSQGVFHDIYPNTLGIDFQVRTINVDGKVVKVQIWDTAGQERFRTLTTSYYRGAHGILLVYNINDRQSFASLEKWHEQISKSANENVVKLLIGNKCDLDGSRQVSYDATKAYADDMGMQFFETSAKTGSNVEESLFGIVGEIKRKLEVREQGQSVDQGNGKGEASKVNVANVAQQTEGKLKGCCA